MATAVRSQLTSGVDNSAPESFFLRAAAAAEPFVVREQYEVAAQIFDQEAERFQRFLERLPTREVLRYADYFTRGSSRVWRAFQRGEAEYASIFRCPWMTLANACDEVVNDRAWEAVGELLKGLRDALEANDRMAFARVASGYRALEPAFQRYLWEWNALDVAGCDGAGDKFDLYPSEFTDAAIECRQLDRV